MTLRKYARHLERIAYEKITIREIIKATGAQMVALGDMEEALNKEIWYVTQDSRETKEGVLFVARVGEVRDGA